MKKLLVIALMATGALTAAEKANDLQAASVEQGDKFAQVIQQLKDAAQNFDALARDDAEKFLNALKDLAHELGKKSWLELDSITKLKEQALAKQIDFFIEEVSSQKFKDSLKAKDINLLRDTNKKIRDLITYREQTGPELKAVIQEVFSELVKQHGGQQTRDLLFSKIAKETDGAQVAARMGQKIDSAKLSQLATKADLDKLSLPEQLNILFADHEDLGTVSSTSENFKNMRLFQVLNLALRELLGKLVQNIESTELRQQEEILTNLLTYVKKHADTIDKQNLTYIRNSVLELFGEILVQRVTSGEPATAESKSGQADKLADLISSFKTKLQESKKLTEIRLHEITEGLSQFIQELGKKAETAQATL